MKYTQQNKVTDTDYKFGARLTSIQTFGILTRIARKSNRVDDRIAVSFMKKFVSTLRSKIF